MGRSPPSQARLRRLARMSQVSSSDIPTNVLDTRHASDNHTTVFLRRRGALSGLTPRNQDRVDKRFGPARPPPAISNKNKLHNACLTKRMEPAWTHEEREFLATYVHVRPRPSRWAMYELFDKRFKGTPVPLDFDESGLHPGRALASLNIELLLYCHFYDKGEAPPREFFERDPAVIKNEELEKLKDIFAAHGDKRATDLEDRYEAITSRARKQRLVRKLRALYEKQKKLDKRIGERPFPEIIADRRAKSRKGPMVEEKPVEAKTDAVTQQMLKTAEAMNGLQIDEKENQAQDQDMEGGVS